MKIGDRVMYWQDGSIGTIVDIVLSSNPFCVEWDDGEMDSYNGDQLVSVSEASYQQLRNK